MKLDPNSLIGRQKARVVRDMLRDFGCCNFSVYGVGQFLRKRLWRDYIDDLAASSAIDESARGRLRRYWETRIDDGSLHGGRVTLKKIPEQTAAAKVLVEALLADGIITRADAHPLDETVWYETTDKGQSLKMAGFTPRMNRAKAEALLSSMLERVAQINADPELLHWVTEVRVFGSYLTDTDDLGDLDVAISLERRIHGRSYTDAAHALARKRSPSLDFFNRLAYPDRLIRQLIKNRSPRISVHDVSELDANPGFGGKMVYTFTPPAS
jgi:predicted nucleotidyltransferase